MPKYRLFQINLESKINIYRTRLADKHLEGYMLIATTETKFDIIKDKTV
jgi:hypothetical protein